MEKKRDIAVDFAKFMAVLLVINSHSDVMWPRFSMLATGGAIGDCLFMFVSGYTLFLGGVKTFGSYYKRRITRILPSVVAALIFNHIFIQTPTVRFSEFLGGEFIEAILIYYILIYFIRKYFINHVGVILGIVAAITLCVYILWFPYKHETSERGLYGVTTMFRWIPYFAFMLVGAYMGMKNQETTSFGTPRGNFLKMLGCLIVFYSIQFAAKIYPPVAPMQIVTLIPLMGIIVYMYRWFKADFFARIYDSPTGNKTILFVSGVCLESYLVQPLFFTDAMNGIWPLNMLIVLVLILTSSYVVRCMARIFAQTFQPGDYLMKKVFSIR